MKNIYDSLFFFKKIIKKEKEDISFMIHFIFGQILYVLKKMNMNNQCGIALNSTLKKCDKPDATFHLWHDGELQ